MTVPPRHETHERSSERTAGWVGLLLIAILLVAGSIVAAAGPFFAGAGSYGDYGPVTGEAFAHYLRKHEERLRPVVGDYEDLLRFADNAGDRAMIDAILEAHPEPAADALDAAPR